MPPLRPIDPGLRDPSRRRRLYLDSAQPSKVTLSVSPGDELDVSDVVADQLVAADSHFKDLDDKDVAAAAKSHVKDAEAAAVLAEEEAEAAQVQATVEAEAEAAVAPPKNPKADPPVDEENDDKDEKPPAEDETPEEISGATVQKPAQRRRRR